MKVNWVLVGDTFFACCSSRLTFSCPLGMVDERAAALAIAADMIPWSVLLSESPILFFISGLSSFSERTEQRHPPFWSGGSEFAVSRRSATVRPPGHVLGSNTPRGLF